MVLEEDKARIRTTEGVRRRPDRVNKFTDSNETLAPSYGKPRVNNTGQAGAGLIKPHAESTTNAVRQRTHVERVGNGASSSAHIENGFPRSTGKPPTGREPIYSVQTDARTIVSVPQGGAGVSGVSRGGATSGGDRGPVHARGTPEYNSAL